MRARPIDTAIVVAAASTAIGLTAWAGQQLVARQVRAGEAGWLGPSLGYAPAQFVMAAVLTLVAVSVTDGFVSHARQTMARARNILAGLTIAAAVAGAMVQPSYGVALAASGLGAVAILSVLLGRKRRNGPC